MPIHIRAIVDGEPIEDESRLEALAEQIEAQRRPPPDHPKPGGSGSPPPPSHDRTRPFEEILQRIEAREPSSFDVFAVTAHNLDVFYRVDRIEPDHETRVTRPVRRPGGSGANTVYGLAKLGRKVGVAGIVAQDPSGVRLKEDLEGAGVDIEALSVVPRKSGLGTGRTLILVDSWGRRLITVTPGINEAWAEYLGKNKKRMDHLRALVRSSKIVHFSSFTKKPERLLQESLIRDLPEDAILSFTPGALYSRLGLHRLDTILRRTNVLFLYRQQLDTLLRESKLPDIKKVGWKNKIDMLFRWRREERHHEPIIVVLKPAIHPIRGISHPRDLLIASGRKELESVVRPDSYAVLREHQVAKDTTGAGDALAAGVLFGLLKGYKITCCADMGFEMATHGSSKLGARPGLPSREEVTSQLSHFDRI